MAERRLWVKLWATWYTTPSHIGVGAMALHVGETLMTLVLWEPGRDDAWAEFETGLPLPIEAIADRAQLSPKAAERALLILEQRGTVSRRPDGAWGFKLYGPSQESADAARKRRTRKPGKVVGVSAECPSDVLRIVEAEVEAEAELTPPTPSPGVSSESPLEAESRPPTKSKAPKPTDPRAQPVIDRIEQIRAELNLNPLQAAHATPKHILARMAEGATIATMLAAVEARAAEIRAGGGAPEYFNAVSLFTGPGSRGPGGWATSLVALERANSKRPATSRGAAPPSPRPTVAGIVDVSTGRVTPIDLGSVSDFLLDVERGDT